MEPWLWGEGVFKMSTVKESQPLYQIYSTQSPAQPYQYTVDKVTEEILIAQS